MSDDLVKKLRLWDEVWPEDIDKPEGHLYEEAANRIEELEAKLDHAELHLRRLAYLQSGGVITGTQAERWLKQALDFLAALVGVNSDKGGKDAK